jgi:glycosyltransferase involved in cell wall biosynthesis
MPAYNAGQTIQQSIMSVIAQSYGDWKIIIRDDMSTDDTVKSAEVIRDHLGLQDKIEIQINSEKKWEVRNVLEMISQCEDDDVICRLDADDWLTDLDVLTILNHRYDVEGVDAAWTAHRWSFTHNNISAPLPPDADVYSHPWVSSHFKTFRKRIINEVKDENFRGEDGEYFRRIGDQAIYLPILHCAKNRHFEPIVAYHYSIELKKETFHTDDAKFQKSEADFLRGRGFL